MRHDVDHDPKTAKKMGITEIALGFNSTYYFRWETADKKIIEYLKNLGHEIGLHYETIATYCKKNNISKKKEVTPDVIDTCRKILKTEILEFEQKYGDISTICSHGDERNRLLGIPNMLLMKRQKPVDYHIKTWANSTELRDIPEIFVAESGNKWDPISLKEAIEKKFRTIYVLIHPIWWSGN